MQNISGKQDISSGKDNVTLLLFILLFTVPVVYIKKEKENSIIDLSLFGPMFSISQFHAIPCNYSLGKVTRVYEVFTSRFMSNRKAAATILLECNETLDLFKEILIFILMWVAILSILICDVFIKIRIAFLSTCKYVVVPWIFSLFLKIFPLFQCSVSSKIELDSLKHLSKLKKVFCLPGVLNKNVKYCEKLML